MLNVGKRKLNSKFILLSSSNLLLLTFVLRPFYNLDVLYYLQLVCFALIMGSVSIQIIDIVNIKRMSSKKTRRILFISISIYSSIFITITILRYLSFTANVLDLGTFLQPLSNTLRGEFMEYTAMELPFQNRCRFGNHFELVYLPLSLFIEIFPGPYFFLIIQTIFLSCSSIPLYRIANKITQNYLVALCVSLCYLSYTGLHYLNLYDIHGDAFAVSFFLLAFDSLLREKNKYWIYLIMAFFCKEYVSLAGIGFGISIFFGLKKYRTGLYTIVLSIAYFFVVYSLIMPQFNDGNMPMFEIARHYKRFGGEEGLLQIVLTIARNPIQFIKLFFLKSNVESIFYAFFPVAFSVFLSPLQLLGALPIFLKDFLFGMNIGNHRLGVTIPFIFISLTYSLKRFSEIGFFKANKTSMNKLLIYLISFSLCSMFFYGPTPLGHRFWREKHRYLLDDKDKARIKIIKKIPKGVTISVSAHLFPHVAKRETCYIYPRPWSELSNSFGDSEYICVDTSDYSLVDVPMNNFTEYALPQILRDGYVLIEKDFGVFLFKKGN